ncbi:MAG TPA: extracellular solute-binding protein [Acidobacteriaceae bacterium]|nr:extracellular solute-binding protein [Acidobacteriaceae bacterium]
MTANKALAAALFALSLCACRQVPQQPVTLSYFRLGWSQPDELSSAEPLSQQFTRRTGIQLKNLPVPENTLDQMSLSRQLLQQGASGPDVLGIDLIWAPLLKDNLLDLRPFLAKEIASIEPALLSSYTVGNKLVALPYQMQVGVLEYRIDLLHRYGFDHPPKTWDELERMAQKIQAGERAKGNKDFWGYVWQGAAAESLTCNALEWQVDAGGGHIIERDRTVSVNNPAAIRSWLRAKHWIGWISPPSVVAYQEQDSMNLFDSGNAAFGRVWGGATIPVSGRTRLTHARNSQMAGETGFANLPGGPIAWAGTLGGSGLAVSIHSLHPQQAVALVRFLEDVQIQSRRQDAAGQSREEFATVPSLRSENPGSPDQSIVARRPSAIAGGAYEQVAKAYISAVHSVLTGQNSGPAAAALLERQLIQITGFRPGPPERLD